MYGGSLVKMRLLSLFFLGCGSPSINALLYFSCYDRMLRLDLLPKL